MVPDSSAVDLLATQRHQVRVEHRLDGRAAPVPALGGQVGRVQEGHELGPQPLRVLGREQRAAVLLRDERRDPGAGRGDDRPAGREGFRRNDRVALEALATATTLACAYHPPSRAGSTCSRCSWGTRRRARRRSSQVAIGSPPIDPDGRPTSSS